jgi:hypothetical protein
MIAINHPMLGAALSVDPLAAPGYRTVERPMPIAMQPQPLQPIRSVETTQPIAPTPSPSSVSPLPVPIQTETAASGSSSSSGTSGALPTDVSNLIDPVTGITYSGYLTPDAQTLYNSGSLVTGGNQLTPQGSALAAQGDLISGTPAPTAAQIAQATPASASSGFMAWLSEETLFAGYPNGLVAAGGVILVAWMFGGKKGRR